ncbi:MAG: HAD family phosphatase [Kofleriaceae bacterium]|jgi:HAD superfamily hydrolase (TIGR01484 family)|nr:HAD family phosphatase [Kofleriaceae bacterium]MBP6841975.1 HAD family phosphatase [Kofleriaceae bacterium]MBP9208101.1 HAD family phosphatase [Kofleriaceae bacterium]
MSRPLSALTPPVKVLFSDVDGTMTTDGRVDAATYAALEQLGAAGVPVVFVTGRPAAFGLAFMTMTHVAAVVTENGGVTFVRDGRKVTKLYGVPPATLPEWRRRMHEAAHEVTAKIPGARLASDCKYREVDLAIDWNEEVSLGKDDADAAVAMLRKAGFAAARSSVHVNFGPPHFDKLSACVTVIRHVFGGDGNDLSPYVYVGDALNDAPMFGGFPKSVGVANVRAYWDELPFKPAFLTERPEGAGLRELITHLLAMR